MIVYHVAPDWDGEDLPMQVRCHAELLDAREHAAKFGGVVLRIDMEGLNGVIPAERIILMPKVVCCECGKVLQNGPLPISHSFCRPCMKDWMKRAQEWREGGKA